MSIPNHNGALIPRRRFLVTTGLALAAAPATGWGQSRPRVSISKAFDTEMESFMAERNVPGGALAVVKGSRLVYAQGYGWADREKKVRAQPDSLFRIASISKPITAVAMFKLIEKGKLSLDDKAFALLGLPGEGKTFADQRLGDITIRQLLQHTAGWDRDKSFDPMFRARQIARAAGMSPPATPAAVIQYMLERPLDFDPGTRCAYSNFGYCVLGRIIEKLTGQGYEAFVREQVLQPAGITRMRIGASRDGRQAPGEVHYYMPDDEGLARNVFGDDPERVPRPYGGFHLEAMDAHGGWIASAIDLARFAAALHEPAKSPLLKPSSFEQMYAPPPPPVSRRKNGSIEPTYFGCGWAIRPVGKGKAHYWHSGSLPGTATLLVRRADGLSWAALFNQRSENGKKSDDEIDSALHRAADAVREWPEADLFPDWKKS